MVIDFLGDRSSAVEISCIRKLDWNPVHWHPTAEQNVREPANSRGKSGLTWKTMLRISGHLWPPFSIRLSHRVMGFPADRLVVAFLGTGYYLRLSHRIPGKLAGPISTTVPSATKQRAS